MLSITSGMLFSCAIFATASISRTLPRGLLIVSPKMHFVFGVMALRKFSGSSGSTKLTLHAQTPEADVELRVRAAVQGVARHEFVAGSPSDW